MEKAELTKEVARLKNSKQAYLNDTYMWVTTCISSLKEMKGTELVYNVPAAKNFRKDGVVTRQDKAGIIKRIVDQDIYFSAFVSSVSCVEDFFSKVMRLSLKFDNDRLKHLTQGINSDIKYTLIEIIDFGSKDEIINDAIEQRITSVLYASPKNQVEYMKKIFGINLSEDIWSKWFEVKATRDIIVHNEAIINKVYLEKAGALARGQKDSCIAITDDYFREVLALMKSLMIKIQQSIENEFDTETVLTVDAKIKKSK